MDFGIEIIGVRLKRFGFSRLQIFGAAALVCILVPSGVARAQEATGGSADHAEKPASTSPPAPTGKSADVSKTESAPASQQVLTPTAQRPTLDQFSWLEGRWRGEWGSRVAEQTWLEPKAGEMAGLFRVIEREKTLVLELFSFVEKPEGIQFYLRHLTPELLPWEKSDATVLKLESVDGTKATFVNPVNGEPKRLIFTRVDADTYTQRSEIEPAEGEPQVIEITFHRQKPPAAAASAGSAARRKKP
jgi:Domain of unknown function (DUF6265)